MMTAKYYNGLRMRSSQLYQWTTILLLFLFCFIEFLTEINSFIIVLFSIAIEINRNKQTIGYLRNFA